MLRSLLMLAGAVALFASAVAVAPVEAAPVKNVPVCHKADDGHYVYLLVNPHSLKHGHTEAKGDRFGLTRDECLALNVQA